MIGRIWHGWTTPENADIYENLLKTEILPGIAAKKVPGYSSIQLFRLHGTMRSNLSQSYGLIL